MSEYVKISNGSYRNIEVNEIFPVVQPLKFGANGPYITVNGTNKFGIGAEKIRIKVNTPLDLEFVDKTEYISTGGSNDEPTSAHKSDDERINEIAERFEILDTMTKAAIAGTIRALIVSGPPGVGKSYGVEKELDKATLFQKIAGKKVIGEVIKGNITPIALYCMLYKHSDENNVIIFDDCDEIFYDPISLNLLKAALDSGKKRRISWLSESRALEREGVPDQFDFKGTIIFITNIDFSRMRGSKIKNHMEALQSRCHYLDLDLVSMRDKMLRIKHVATTSTLFDDYQFGPTAQDEILEFMYDNKDTLREMSLRMAIKIADLYQSFPLNWQAMTSTTCMKSST